jgi:hypothetical protein
MYIAFFFSHMYMYSTLSTSQLVRGGFLEWTLLLAWLKASAWPNQMGVVIPQKVSWYCQVNGRTECFVDYELDNQN